MGHYPSFGWYESMRIAIPGVFFALSFGLYFGAYLSRYTGNPATLTVFVAFCLLSIAAGFTFYAKETPKRRRAFFENQPSAHLNTIARTMKGVPLLNDDEARRVYFYILNNSIPPPFHEKIFFFGTVYHIMISIRRTALWLSVLCAVTIAVEAVFRATPFSDLQNLILCLAFFGLVYVLNVRYNKADRRMQETYQDQIHWMQMNRDLIEEILKKSASFPPLDRPQ